MLGLGEVGAAIAADLVRTDHVVLAYDPDATRSVQGVHRVASAEDVAAEADILFSANSQSAAVAVAASVQSRLTDRQVFADANTASPGVKREVAALVESCGAACADVALLAPVPAHGVATPALASGSGAARFAEVFGAAGMPVEVLNGPVGEAATRKLLRSIFMKGLAAAVLESLAAAHLVGCDPWLRRDIERTLAAADEAIVERLVTGSRQHARRRIHEMRAAEQLIAELGLRPHVARAAADVLAELERDGE